MSPRPYGIDVIRPDGTRRPLDDGRDEPGCFWTYSREVAEREATATRERITAPGFTVEVVER